MASGSHPEDPCGCGGDPARHDHAAGAAARPRTPRGTRVRTLATPDTIARTRLHDVPEPLQEVMVTPPGFEPMRLVVPAKDATPELLRTLVERPADLATLRAGPGQGAVDIRLEMEDGSQVKEGTLLLERAQGLVEVPLDPVTRRFRLSGVAPGSYDVRASASAYGRGFRTLHVREGDVTRAAIRLDGVRPRGTATVRLAVAGARGGHVHVRATDRLTGRVVAEKRAPIDNGIIAVDVPFGRIHWDIIGDDASSCYDTDVGDDLIVNLPPRYVELKPRIPFEPDPPDRRFAALGLEHVGVARFLPRIGIDSIEELAAAEPEDLMHRALKIRDSDSTPIHSRSFGQAVMAARSALGLGSAPETDLSFRLGTNQSLRRVLKPSAAGDIPLDLDLGDGERLEISIHGPHGTERKVVTGAPGGHRTVIPVSAADVASGASFEVTLTNRSPAPIAGAARARLPIRGVVPWRDADRLDRSIESRIRSILEGLAERNPGLGTDVPDAVMAPENIQMWLDRARAFMDAVGVCSVNDLGRFRLNPMPILRTGAYVAPVVQPPNLSHVPALVRYSFDRALQNSVLYYRPNDILHETAVILGNEWDIRNQVVIIGKEVRELWVVVGSILHDGVSRITWEMPPLPAATSYWPSPAPPGANGNSPGAAGGNGAPGDPAPHPSRNGGADAVTAAPIVTMFIRNATNGIPPIDLRGQQGGPGGRGQDGGRGGDGATGLRADGTFFGGCCREVGAGGAGGVGGDAGRGGPGGKGGEGGKLTLLTTAPGIMVLEAARPAFDVNGGPGGFGGFPGNPGAGGTGGAAGTADCETWCDEHPERRGADGASGNGAALGVTGPAGPGVVEDAIQILPITDEQWVEEFNRPHILSVAPLEAEPDQTVSIVGHNFNPSGDRVFFDGANVGPVATGTTATFTVPIDSDGGYHPVVIRPAGPTDRRSNRVMVKVLPKLDALPAPPRWLENQIVTLTGLAFSPGAQVFAEDRSVTPAASFALPIIGGVTRTSIVVQVPGGFLGPLRGVRRIVVRNPDGGTTRDERVIRISDTIVVRCAAFRVLGTTPGVGTTRTAAEITNLFNEASPLSISAPWGQARIAFRLVQPVADLTRPDDIATVWPIQNLTTDQAAFTAAGTVLGSINVFFVRDVQVATAYAYFGGGPIFMGDEGGPLGATDWQQVLAHEVGHALCLRHICDAGEGPGTFFNRECEDDDEAFLMYPFWNASDGMGLHAGQIDPARTLATHFEDGKTAALQVPALFMANNTSPQCGAPDAQN